MSFRAEGQGSMLIAGKWMPCDDGITRPMIDVTVAGLEESLVAEPFLVDTAADRTVFSAALLKKLRLPGNQVASELALQGIGGATPHVVLRAVLEFTRDDGGPARL